MSTWSEAVDALCLKIEQTLGSATPYRYVAIPEAIELEEGGDLYLRHGYGVDIGSGSAFRNSAGGKDPVDSRLFVISLTRQITSTASNTESRKDLKVEMLEHAQLLRTAIEADVTLGCVVTSTLYESDSGVQFLETDRDKYYLLEMQYNLTVRLT